MVRHSLYKFSVKLVDFLLASMLSTVIASYAFSQNITGRVESIRPNFFLNISTDYDLFNCRFNTDDAEDLWLLCDLRAKNDDKSAFAWLLPRQKDGVWGEPLILDREVHDGKQFSQVLRIISAKEFLVDYVDGYSTIVKVGVDIKARSLYKRLLPNWYYPISKAIHEGWKITQVQFDRNGYIVLLNKTNLYVNIYGNKKPLEVFRVISIDDRGRENWIYNFERQIEVDSLNSELDPIQVIYDAASISKKSLFITADDKVVVYGTTGGYKTSSLAADGTLVVCLQTNGKELHRVFWKNAYWSHPIAWHVLSGSENFAFAYYEINESNGGRYFIQSVDKNCQALPRVVLSFPSHNLGETFNTIKSLIVDKKDHLWIAYLQEEVGSERDMTKQLPALYIAKVDKTGKLLADIPVIVGTNPDRQYLVTYLGGEGIDLLKITLALLPSEAQLLMSVHNMGVDSENHPAIPKVFLDPRIYSISIP